MLLVGKVQFAWLLAYRYIHKMEKLKELTRMQQNKLNNRHVDRLFGMHTYTNTSKDMQAGRQTPKYAIKMYIPLTWHQGLQGIHLLSSLCLFLPKFYILSINSLHSSCRERGSPLLMLRTQNFSKQ